MKEIEITCLPPLDPKDRSLLDMHTLLNVLNVLRGELALIGLELTGDPDHLRTALGICDWATGMLRDPEAALANARTIDQHVAAIMADIHSALAAHPGKEANAEIRESLSNLESVFAILRTRARELLARAHAPDHWVEFSVTELHHDFMGVFAAIEKNSRGRYRLLYNAALQEEPDYYIDFKIESVDAPVLLMPAVFQDVMRDLIANARKYTLPGGHITAALHAGHDALRFFVEDTGRGIPADEIETVVEFGRRASNVGDVRTMGGGFGLTKAFLVTKQFGGRFWIGSRVGVGTRIRICLPRPKSTPGRNLAEPFSMPAAAPGAAALPAQPGHSDQ